MLNISIKQEERKTTLSYICNEDYKPEQHK